MNTAPDHTHTFAFGNSSGNHLGLQIAPPLRPLPSVHDLSLSQTLASQTGHTKDRAVPCLYKKPMTQPLGAMGQEICALELLSPLPRAKERLGSKRLSSSPRAAGQWRNLGKKLWGGFMVSSPITLHLANLPSQEMHPTPKWGSGNHVVANFSSQVLFRVKVL